MNFNILHTKLQTKPGTKIRIDQHVYSTQANAWLHNNNTVSPVLSQKYKAEIG